MGILTADDAPRNMAANVKPLTSLIFGGAASGKSQFAEDLALKMANHQQKGRLLYLATGQPLDEEMAARIGRHRARRGGRWQTIEEPLALASAIADTEFGGNDAPAVMLIDCLTLWLSNILSAGHDFSTEIDALCKVLSGHANGAQMGQIILVSNEIGMGLVPEQAQARHFRDLHGRMNQRVGAACSQVIFVAGGLPLTLKGDYSRGNLDDDSHHGFS